MTSAGARVRRMSTSANAPILATLRARRVATPVGHQNRSVCLDFDTDSRQGAARGGIDVLEPRYRGRTSVDATTRAAYVALNGHGEFSGPRLQEPGLGRVATPPRGAEAAGGARVVSASWPAQHRAGQLNRGRLVARAAYPQNGRQSLTREVWC